MNVPLNTFFGWLPASWSQFTGNVRALKLFKSLVRQIRRSTKTGKELNKIHFSIFLAGISRSGKTALVKFFVRCLVCQKLDPETLDPCDGTCPICRDHPERGSHEELFAYLTAPGGTTPVNLVMIDCAKILDGRELIEALHGIRERFGLQVVYLDEVHRLIKRSLDQTIMKEIEEKKNIWISSTAEPAGLEKMFMNRNITTSTDLPSVHELTDWIKDRCDEVGLRYEPAAVIRLAGRCNRTPGIALLALSYALLDPDVGLTLNVVENEWTPPSLT